MTRSLIYYYFGRSKVSILKEGVKVIGEELVGLNERRIRMWKEGRFLDSGFERSGTSGSPQSSDAPNRRGLGGVLSRATGRAARDRTSRSAAVVRQPLDGWSVRAVDCAESLRQPYSPSAVPAPVVLDSLAVPLVVR